MRGLTLWQPQCWALAVGHKDVENRPWPLPGEHVGTWIALHAGLKYDQEWAKQVRMEFGIDVPPMEIARGAVVAVVKFSPSVTSHSSRWFSGPHGFPVSDRRVLEQPVPCRGMLGLWTLPSDVEAEVRRLSGLSDDGPPKRQQGDLFG